MQHTQTPSRAINVYQNDYVYGCIDAGLASFDLQMASEWRVRMEEGAHESFDTSEMSFWIWPTLKGEISST